MKRSHWWETWLLLICVRATIGYYHELSKKIITDTNLTADSYFGYSISYQANIKRYEQLYYIAKIWKDSGSGYASRVPLAGGTYLQVDENGVIPYMLIVGAPKALVLGRVYKVDLNTSELFPVETPQILITASQNVKSNVSSHYNFLYGATVMAGPQSFVSCAPNRALYFTGSVSGLTKLVVYGLCFNHPTTGATRELKGHVLTAGNVLKSYGWSLRVTKKNDIVIGTPALNRGYVRVNFKGEENKEPKILTPRGVTYSFGYSITSGNYFDENMTSLYYAVSSPYGMSGTGTILFYNANKYTQRGDTIQAYKDYVIKNHRLGSLFGAALCTVNLGESQDQLLVGAPTYSNDNDVDRGAVHLYIVKNKKFVLHKTIESDSDSAVYFGYSMANLGDLDGDFKDEVAIGAPYENEGRGAVYIYSGAGLIDPNKNGKQMLIQRLAPGPKEGLTSFGLSLTSIRDYDENGCNELAVGAPETNRVVVYRCFAYMTIKLYARFPTRVQPHENGQEDKLVFQSCFNVTFPKKPENIDEKIRMEVKVSHQDVWFWAQGSNGKKTESKTMTYDIRVTRGQETFCSDVEAVVRKKRSSSGGLDFEIMTYTITASLIDDVRYATDFASSRVLLSPQSSLFVNSQESLADCQGENCKPNLLLEFNSNMKNLYTVGSTSEGSFSFFIKNEGATAYTPCLMINIKGAPLLGLPPDCTIAENRENLICKPIFLLKKGSDWTIGNITMDTRYLTSRDEKITVSHTLYSRCYNQSSIVVSRKADYILISATERIEVTQKSEPGDVVDIFSEPSRVRHVYTITNKGVTPWEGVSIDFGLGMKKDVITYDNIIVEMEDETKTCEISETMTEEFSALCNDIDLKKDKNVKVIIPIVIKPLEGRYSVEKQNVSTSLTLHLKDEVKESSATTQLVFKKSTVPLWIILVASLLALIILILLGYALYSVGYLKRKKKGELVALKKSVYRQSQRRATMRESTRSGGNDIMSESLISEQHTTAGQQQSDDYEIDD